MRKPEPCRCALVKSSNGAAAEQQARNASKASGGDVAVYSLAASLGICTPCARARHAANRAWKRRVAA